MVSGHRRRRLVNQMRAGALLMMVGAMTVACGNIGLSSASGFAAGPDNAGDAYNLHENDGASMADGGSLPPAADAGAPNTYGGNPLCNVGIQNEAGRPCDPDYPAPPSGPSCQPPDGGATADDGGIELSCHVVVVSNARTQACSIGGKGGDGNSCQTGADCAPSYECVGMPGRCRHYCCSGDKSCSGLKVSSFCDIQATAESNLKVPVCSPVSPCKLLTPNACPEGETCTVVTDDGVTSCVTIGPALVGQACDTSHCADGLTCLGRPGTRECYKLCRLGYPQDCDYGSKCTGSAQLFSDPSDGICQ
jgi:hypothetical protein